MDQDAALNPAHIELDRSYPHPPATVWQALTDSSVVAKWFLPSVGYSAEVGAQFMFLVPTDPPAEVACEVLEAEPVSRLTWNWRDMRSATTPCHEVVQSV